MRAFVIVLLAAAVTVAKPALAQIIEFPIPAADSNPYGITAGPDGALWFTEGAGNNIGRITTAGVISEFPTTLTLCQTDPTSGACLATPTPNTMTMIAANATPTFGIFVAGSAAVPDLPAVNRVFVRFTDAGGAIRGETSVAVRTR